MRMPLSDFLTNGDLKFVIVILAFFGTAIIFFFKKLKQKEQQEIYNLKIKKLINWSLLISFLSLLLGLLHSFYFISKVNGITNNLLFGGLTNVLITPTLGVIVAIIIKFLATPITYKN